MVKYKVKVVPVDTGSFTLGFRLNSNAEVKLASNVSIPDLDSIFMYELTVLETIKGDADRDAKQNLKDIIFLVNFIFKGGPMPEPLALGNVNCDYEPNG